MINEVNEVNEINEVNKVSNIYPPVFRDHRVDDGGLWIFGYGSLMWRPGFDYLEKRSATLNGFHRAFCIYSTHHRGTKDVPGLVLGLDQGAACLGMAYRVASNNAPDVVAYLDERELIGYAYIPILLPIVLEQDGDNPPETVIAYTFIADTSHPQYAGEMDISKAAEIIMNAEGIAGLNRDYLINTVRHLEQVGSTDDKLHTLLNKVEQFTGSIDMGSGI